MKMIFDYNLKLFVSEILLAKICKSIHNITMNVRRIQGVAQGTLPV